ncbi:MAG TPA: hypothetical protein VNO81_10245 [Candidatus Nitrosotenuis sp.]|nr:hypothetical protein [Candidatus Nitrosotenuis sp.]
MSALLGLDRRWIFGLVALAVSLPLFLNLRLAAAEAGLPVRRVFDKIESLPRGSVVWMGFDYYATTTAECSPAARVLAWHLFSRGCKIVATSLIPDGALLSRSILDQVAGQFQPPREYGRDYVVLGYKSGTFVVINQVCQDLRSVYPADRQGRALADMPLTAGLRGVKSFAMAVTVSDNKSFDYYAIVANTQYGLPVAGAATAVMVPELQPYYNSGQILGILAGMRGAAEYEALLHRPGTASAGMAAQSVMHFLVCALVVLGNLAFFASRRRP